jgi:outer membrane receptor protein involved in Fe transport
MRPNMMHPRKAQKISPKGKGGSWHRHTVLHLSKQKQQAGVTIMRAATILAVALLTSGGLGAAERAHASITRYELNIPRQPLDTALKDLAQQTGLQVGRFSDAVTGDAVVGPVAGNYSADQALKTLLAPTKLTYRTLNERAIIVLRPEDVAQFPSAKALSDHQITGERSGVMASGKGSQESENSSGASGQKSFWSRLRLAQGTSSSSPTVDSSSPSARERRAGQEGENSNNQNSDASSGSPARLEEIVVTAQKRYETLQNVPLAVSALSDATLREIGATEFSDYARLVPGLTAIDLGVGQKKYILRGLNSESAPRLAAIVQQYVDEFPLTLGTLQSDIRLYDVERVEVLRGPQGTLYGSGSMGGTIRTITRKPNLEKFDGRVEVTGSETHNGGGNLLGNAVVNIPLVPGKLAVRALVFDEERPGFIDNIYTGKKGVNDNAAIGGRVSLLWQATEALALDMTIMRQSVRAGAQNEEMPGFVPPPKPRYFPPVVPWFPANTPSVGDLQVAKATDEKQRDVNTITNLLATYDLGWASLTSSSTAYLQHKIGNQDVTDLLGFGGLLHNDAASKTFGQELRLANDRGTFKWLIGGYYLRSTQTAQDNSQAAYFPDGSLFFVDGSDTKTIQKAVFGETSYEFLPKLTGTVGIRSANLYTRTTTIVLAGTDPGGLPIGAVTGPFSVDESKVTTKYELTFRPSAETTVYGLAAQGFRPGGFNDVAFNPVTNPNGAVPKTFKSDQLWNYELGFKTYLLDHTATFNTAVYYIAWSDIQVTGFDPTTGATSFETNAGKAKVQGVETEFAIAATQNLRLYLRGAYPVARLTEEPPTRPGAVNSSIGLTGLKGDRLPDVPRWSGSALADYRHAFGQAGWTGFVTGVVTYSAESANLLRTDDSFYRRQGNYALVNLRFGMDRSDWRVTAFLDNLTDRRARLFVNTLSGWDKINVNRPRTVGVTLSRQF